jgi:S1-C subfamily serine protease
MAANGQRVKRNEDLVAVLEELNVDDVVQLTVRRGDQSLTIPAKLLKDLAAGAP